MNCPTCGHTNQSDSVFCSKCAAKLSSAAGAVDPSAARPAPYSPYAGNPSPQYPPPRPYGHVPPPYANPYANPYGDGLPRSGNAVTILVLGILSIVVCGVMGPIAWAMGKKELDRMNGGELSREGYGMAQAGYICGIIGSVLLGLTLLWVLFVFSRIPF